MLKTISLLSIGFLCGIVFHFLVGALARIRQLRRAAQNMQQHLKRVAEEQAARDYERRARAAKEGLL